MVKYSVTLNTALPNRGTPYSAGVDLFIPQFDEAFLERFWKVNPHLSKSVVTLDSIFLYPQEKVMIPTGIRTEFDHESALIVFDKGGVPWKDHVTHLAEVIDSDFQSGIFVMVHNYSNNVTELKSGKKIIQVVRVPVFLDEWKRFDDAEIHTVETQRGKGSQGSTGL